MDKDPNVLEVTVHNLDTWRAALNSALMQNTVLDLNDQYRKLSQRSQHSPMTKALMASVEEIDQILSVEEETDE